MGHPPLVGDEGGWAPPLPSNEAAVAMVAEASADVGSEVVLGLDVASTHFVGTDGRYALPSEGRGNLSAGDLVALLSGWADRFPIASIEDGLAEDDWDGWRLLQDALGERVQLIGDDLFVTNVGRLQRGIDKGVGNAVLVKVNQAGTLTEALDVVAAARAAGYAIVVSARSGETEDAFLADLATGVAADQIKVGSVTRSSRLAKWNQLLRLQEELGRDAYAGRAGLPVLRGAPAATEVRR
jgi:enolase